MGTWMQGTEQEWATLSGKTGPLGPGLLILNKTLLPFLLHKYNDLSYILQTLENLHFTMKTFSSDAI